ncbi:MAG TPA: aldehyde dehydrogenase family protein [Candidatus Baltobacteraceae bacterium]
MNQLERDLETLDASKDAWARLAVERKIRLFEDLKRSVHAVAPDWAQAASRAKGIAQGSPLEGEEWLTGPWGLLHALTCYIRTLRGIATRGLSPVPAARRRADGRTIVPVFPRSIAPDLVLGSGTHAEVWMQTGVTPEDVRAEAGSFYRRGAPRGRVALVLGAGNIASIAPLDVLYKMIADGSVCMLKMNPVNDYLGPILERAFSGFVDAGYLRFAYGGADAGSFLCSHDLVTDIHITGSESTHAAIVAAAGTRKRITSELGNVSPTIVVPGPWNDRDLNYQALHIATQKAHNAGFNCISAQVLIVPKDWDHTEKLARAVGAVFERMEQRPEYYPGAAARRTALAGSAAPLRTVTHVDASDNAHPAFTTETFSGVLACAALSGDLHTFVRAAVTLANERLRGTLGANLIVHPATMRQHPELIDWALATLRYGTIGVNVWTGAGFLIPEVPWGAYPGHTLEDAGSGIGVVHNSYLLERTEKTVLRAPFTPFPRSLRRGELNFMPAPPWYVTSRSQAEIGKALCDFDLTQSPADLLRVLKAGMRS